MPVNCTRENGARIGRQFRRLRALRFTKLLLAFCALLLIKLSVSAATLPKRSIPVPLAGHPGNIFLDGEEVVVPLPAGDPALWRVVDYDGRLVAQGAPGNGRANLGQLPVGYYEIQSLAEGGARTNIATLGVLSRLQAPTPLTSPIGIDGAMAWFYPEDKMPAAASLCALAGINWVRDRLNWAQMEPDRGHFASTNCYDASAHIQNEAGLQVLQVNHISPSWANPQTKRFPLDLRDSYRFHREIAQRWRGQVVAFEPWNEADIDMFGGHTGSEMASLQKAAFLGLKAGNPKVIACLNVFATHRASTLRDLQENGAWPYFDTFNLHHYEPFGSYPKLYSDLRAASAGRPLWVTECSVPVKWSGDDQLKEPTSADLRVQAERVVKTYALALHEGAQAVFYFLLPHYVEGQTQFGIVRPDLTPRPAFLALAAAGRLLADAQPLGQFECGDPAVRGFLFHAKPGGATRQVLVLWSDSGGKEIDLRVKPVAAFDHLGRELRASGTTIQLNAAPVFTLLQRTEQFTLTPTPKPAPWLAGSASPVVLQVALPPERIDLKQSAYRLKKQAWETVPVIAYNFSDRPLKGRLCVDAPSHCQAELVESLALAAGERRELALRVRVGEAPVAEPTQVVVRGEFGRAGKPELSFRVRAVGQTP